ncbi:MAG: CapA family protein [Spirochaetia bacterium]|nr:CapA family protein [Spirochaetia bacterium]
MLKFLKYTFFLYFIQIAGIQGIFLNALFAKDIPSYLWEFSKDEKLFHEKIYLVPVTDFQGKTDEINIASPENIFSTKIVVSGETWNIIKKTVFENIRIIQVSHIENYLKKHPDQTALVRISEITPQMRILPVNGIYFYEPGKKYMLSLISSRESANSGDELSRIFTFAQTGVTALARGIINKVNQQKDPLFISKKIAPFLRQFHLTHTSNEVSFTENCEFSIPTMLFCAPIEYIKILQDCGLDIIELTGNHNNDYGREASEFTLRLYEKNGLRYYGGGKNLKDAQKILYVEIAGKKLALIAYNQANVYWQYDLPLAREDFPGANPFDMEKMKTDIGEARKNAQTVIVDFQFAECDAYKVEGNGDCYNPMTKPDQRGVFQKAIDFGADIVVGTQAHQPQVIEKFRKGIIFYGLGNLFFDQTRWEGTRQGMILVHIFFDGLYKSTIVYPTYFDENMQVHLANDRQKKELLDIYYQRE